MSFRTAAFIVLFALSVSAVALPVELCAQEPSDRTIEKEGTLSAADTRRKIILTVHRVVELLLRSNTDVKKALLEYRSASHGLLMYEARYDPLVAGSVEYAHGRNPDPTVAMTQGQSSDSVRYQIGLQKGFNTGTTLNAGVTGSVQKITGAGLPVTDVTTYLMDKNLGGMRYQTGVTVQLTQELLRNSFGMSERLSSKKLAASARAAKEGIRMKLAALLADAVVGYWNVAIAEENLRTSREGLTNTEAIRDLIGRKARLGLAEGDEVLDWDSRVLQGRNSRDRADKLLFDARLTMMRTLNLDPSLEIEVGATFREDPPSVKVEEALHDAFTMRSDWKAIQALIAAAEAEYRIAESEALPSLRLKAAAGSVDVDRRSYPGTLNNVNPVFSTGMEMTYPLGNSAAETRLKEARLSLSREKLNAQALEKQIRDEVVSAVKQCETDYEIFRRTRRAREYAVAYYQQVLAKFRQGRYSVLQLKLALDAYLTARYAELQSLVAYNVSLLRRDVVRNTVFRDLGIDIDGVLRMLDE